jgi:hypothetical protein
MVGREETAPNFEQTVKAAQIAILQTAVRSAEKRGDARRKK